MNMFRPLAMFSLAAALCAVASAQGLLGQRYGSASFTATQPGDDGVRHFDDWILGGSAEVSLPVDSHVDFAGTFHFSELDGTYRRVSLDAVSRSLELDATLHFAPRQPVDPALTFGLLYSQTDVTVRDEAGSRDTDSDDWIGRVQAGVQFNFGRGWSAFPYFDFAYWFNNDNIDDNVGLGLGVSKWLNTNWAVNADASTEAEDGDLGLSISLIRGF